MGITREEIIGTKILNEIKSSNIKKTEYDTETKLLIIEFNSPDFLRGPKGPFFF